MSGEHYTKNTSAVQAYCSTCNRRTMHRVDNGRKGPCTEHGGLAEPAKDPEPEAKNNPVSVEDFNLMLARYTILRDAIERIEKAPQKDGAPVLRYIAQMAKQKADNVGK